MNPQLAKLLEGELITASNELSVALESARKARALADALEQKVDAYKRALAAAKDEDSSPPTKIEPFIVGAVEVPPEVNKSQIARDFIFANPERGVTAKDIADAFRKAGVSFHINYPWSVLRRLAKNKTIKEIRGRYYPVPDSKRPDV